MANTVSLWLSPRVGVPKHFSPRDVLALRKQDASASSPFCHPFQMGAREPNEQNTKRF